MCARPNNEVFSIGRTCGLRGELELAGDKSIAHRAIILSSISRGKVIIQNFPVNDDCLATLGAFSRLGVRIQKKKNSVIVFGKGLEGFNKPESPIFLAESGTTARLILGVLAGQDFEAKITSGKSLAKRPMRRVTEPLRMMGAKIAVRQEEYLPITIEGGNLRGITYRLPLASAQVKSAILLAGLYAQGATKVIEPIKTRDHTERMLALFKADVKVKKNTITIRGNKELVSPQKIYIPADISSASFFIVAASIVPGSKIIIKNVSLNPTRTGILRVLKRMGADIRVRRRKVEGKSKEPIGNILVKSAKLKSTVVRKGEIPSLIDELPILMVAACFARGRTIFEGVEELRVKETDRSKSMYRNLRKMGADIEVRRIRGAESIVINGRSGLHGAKVKSFGDHRTAMSMIIAGLMSEGKTRVDDIGCINKSFPGFIVKLKSLGG